MHLPDDDLLDVEAKLYMEMEEATKCNQTSLLSFANTLSIYIKKEGWSAVCLFFELIYGRAYSG